MKSRSLFAILAATPRPSVVKLLRVSIISGLLSVAVLPSAQAIIWHKPNIGGGWHPTVKSACEAHRARQQEASDAALPDGADWNKRTIYRCTDNHINGYGQYVYKIVGSRASDDKWQGTYSYYTTDVSCANGLKPSSTSSPYTCNFPTEENAGQSCSMAGNPINFTVGNKFQKMVDLPPSSRSPLELVRYYNSSYVHSRRQGTFYRFWRHSYDRFIYSGESATGANLAQVEMKDGKVVIFSRTNGTEWQGSDRLQLDSIEDSTGKTVSWTLINGLVTEHYDHEGKLVQIVDAGARTNTVLAYNDLDYLINVADQLGNTLTFEYSQSGLITHIIHSNDDTYSYAYDDNRLSEVAYPDGTVEIYHYESAQGGNLLTAVTDRNEHRYVEWQYDSSSRATVSQHISDQGSIVDKVEIDYTFLNDASDPKVTVTNPLGKQTTYHYAVVNGVRKVVSVEGHASANCAAASKSYEYYDNGLIRSKTDWKGNVTYYQYNDRGLETVRIEAFGTLKARSTVTEWHSAFNLPIRVVNINRETIFSYDVEGRLQGQSSSESTIPGFQNDLDQDGLLDSWELQYFGVLDYVGEDDFDGDGLTNSEEYAASSDPTINLNANHLDPNNTNSQLVLSNNSRTMSNSQGVWLASIAKGALPLGRKYYWEVQLEHLYTLVGIASDMTTTSYVGSTLSSYGLYAVPNGGRSRTYNNGSWTRFPVTNSPGDRVMIAFDPDAGKLWFGVNGQWEGDPVAGTGARYTNISGLQFPAVSSRLGQVTVMFQPNQFLYPIPAGFEDSQTVW